MDKHTFINLYGNGYVFPFAITNGNHVQHIITHYNTDERPIGYQYVDPDSDDDSRTTEEVARNGRDGGEHLDASVEVLS